MSKDAIDKVFAEKAYKKVSVNSQTLTNFQSQYSSVGGGNILQTFKSNQYWKYFVLHYLYEWLLYDH